MQNINRMLFEARSPRDRGRDIDFGELEPTIPPPVTPTEDGPFLTLSLYRSGPSPLADQIQTIPAFHRGEKNYGALIARDRSIVYMSARW